MPPPPRFLASARLIATLTFGSRLLGMLREAVFGYLFSTTEFLSAFRIAFMVPNLARRLFGEGALSAALIPVLTQEDQVAGDAAARLLVGQVLKWTAKWLCVGVVGGELVVLLWRTIKPDFALDLTLVLLPYMVLICTVAILGGALNVRNHFAAPAATPMVLNLSVIGASLGGALIFDLSGRGLTYAVAGGVLVAGLLQLVLIAAAMKRINFFPIFGGPRSSDQTRKVFGLMGPMVLGLSAVQINTLADHLIAYWLIEVDGERVGPAVLGYAQYLYQVPLGVFGIAIATAIFPVLSKRATEKDQVGLAETVSSGIRLSWFVAFPSAVGLILVAHPLVATILEHGTFQAKDTQRVADTVIFYSLGLPAYFVQHVLVRTFYALQDSKTPARIAGSMVGLNLALNLALVGPLQERGLALATAISAVIQMGWLTVRLSSRLPELRWGSILAQAWRCLLAALVMGAVLVLLKYSNVFTGGWVAVELIVSVALGATVYGLVAKLMRLEELSMLLRRSDPK